MPKSPEGKDISSQNALKHGVRSKRLILPDEAEDDYRLTREGWFDEFRPETFREERLVDLLVQADWYLRRAHRRMEEAEAAVVGEENTNPADWTAEQVRTVELMQRYKTTAERAFYRALNACEQTRKDERRNAMLDYNLQCKLIEQKRQLDEKDRQLAEKDRKIAELAPKAEEKAKTAQEEAEPLSRAEQLFQGQRKPGVFGSLRSAASSKKRKKIVYLDQWVEVEVSPTGKTVDTWLDVIEEEKELGTGHMLPTLTLPRPEEVHINLRLADKARAHLGCDCKVCTHSRKVLEEAA